MATLTMENTTHVAPADATNSMQPPVTNSQLASLYVGDLNPDVTETQLYEIFQTAGHIASIRVCRDSVTRKSLGYAYVNFHSVPDAERALDIFNFTDIRGRACRIMWSHRNPSYRKGNVGNIFVKSLCKSIDNKSLYDTFSIFGNILSCKVEFDADGKSKGFGFVHYETAEAATKAIKNVNGMQIEDKTVYVGPFIPKCKRQPNPVKYFTNVYIKNIPSDWDEKKIKEYFQQFGDITSAHVVTGKRDKKFAFVNYKTMEEAKAAIGTAHGTDLSEGKVARLDDDGVQEDTKLYVQRAQTKGERVSMLKEHYAETETSLFREGCNLYVKNLDDGIDDEELQKLFEPYGKIVSAKVQVDENGVSKGFGYICFSSPEEANRALEMRLRMVNGKPLYVRHHEKKADRMERCRLYRGMPQRSGIPPFNPSGSSLNNLQNANIPGASPQYYSQQMPNRGIGMGGQRQNAMLGFGQRAMIPNYMHPVQNMVMGIGKGAGKGMSGLSANAMSQGQMPQGMAGFDPRHRGMPPQMNPASMIRPGMPNPNQVMSSMAGMAPISMGLPGGLPANPMQSQMANTRNFDPSIPLTAVQLQAAPPGVQKQMLGEKLYPLIFNHHPEMAGKITGMMLEMENSELLLLLESESQLKAKVEEALRVLSK